MYLNCKNKYLKCINWTGVCYRDLCQNQKGSTFQSSLTTFNPWPYHALERWMKSMNRYILWKVSKDSISVLDILSMLIFWSMLCCIACLEYCRRIILQHICIKRFVELLKLKLFDWYISKIIKFNWILLPYIKCTDQINIVIIINSVSLCTIII